MDGPKYKKDSPPKYQKVTTCVGCARFANCDDRIYKVRNSVSQKWGNAELYTVETEYLKGRGLPMLADKNGNRITLSKREWDILPADEKQPTATTANTTSQQNNMSPAANSVAKR
jgi:hypothetical protein